MGAAVPRTRQRWCSHCDEFLLFRRVPPRQGLFPTFLPLTVAFPTNSAENSDGNFSRGFDRGKLFFARTSAMTVGCEVMLFSTENKNASLGIRCTADDKSAIFNPVLRDHSSPSYPRYLVHSGHGHADADRIASSSSLLLFLVFFRVIFWEEGRKKKKTH